MIAGSSSQSFDQSNYILFEPDNGEQHLGVYVKTSELTNPDELNQIVKKIFDYFQSQNIPVTLKMGNDLILLTDSHPISYQLLFKKTP